MEEEFQVRIDPGDIVIYRELIQDECRKILDNKAAFIQLRGVSTNLKVAKLYEILDFFVVDESPREMISEIESLIEILNIKSLVEGRI
jgi:hypothetical protein